MHSGCGNVHVAYPLPTGQNILAYLICGCFYLDTVYFCFLPLLPFRTLQLLGCVLHGHPRCETCAFVCLLCRLLVSAPFYCCKCLLHLSMDFVSQEHGVPRNGPKDSNAGGWTCEILDRNETRWRKPRLSNAQRTAEKETELYPGSGPSWWGKTPTSCLLVLQRDTSRGVQGLGYKALAGQRLKNLCAQLAAWRRWRFDQTRSPLRGGLPLLL
jgi:hypothetical protein